MDWDITPKLPSVMEAFCQISVTSPEAKCTLRSAIRRAIFENFPLRTQYNCVGETT